MCSTCTIIIRIAILIENITGTNDAKATNDKKYSQPRISNILQNKCYFFMNKSFFHAKEKLSHFE